MAGAGATKDQAAPAETSVNPRTAMGPDPLLWVAPSADVLNPGAVASPVAGPTICSVPAAGAGRVGPPGTSVRQSVRRSDPDSGATQAPGTVSPRVTSSSPISVAVPAA